MTVVIAPEQMTWTERLTFTINDTYLRGTPNNSINEDALLNVIQIFNFLESHGKHDLYSISPTRDGGLYFSISLKHHEDAISMYFQISGRMIIIDNRKKAAVFETHSIEEAKQYLRKKIKLNKSASNNLPLQIRLYKNNHGYIPYYNSDYYINTPRTVFHVANLSRSALFNSKENKPALHMALCGAKIIANVKRGVKDLAEVETRIDSEDTSRSGYCKDCLKKASFIVAALS